MFFRHLIIGMHSDYYDKVRDILSREDFDLIVKNLDEEFGNLLERDVLEMMLIDEMNRNRKYILPISDLKDATECTIFGKVMEKFDHSKKVVISDNTSSCRLALRDNNIDIFDLISLGCVVKVINGYVRRCGRWIEVNAGRWSQIEIDPEDAPSINIEPFTGEIFDIEETRIIFRDDGETVFSRKVWVKSDSTLIPVTAWGEHVKILKKAKVGDIIEVFEPVVRMENKRLIEVDAMSISKIDLLEN